MAKRKGEAPQHEVSKRQVARWQQQRRRQRLVFSLGILVIVAVLAVVGAGWYLSSYQPQHQTVIRVNGTSFNMNYYVDALRLYASGQDPQTVQFLTGYVVNNIEQSELVRQAATKLGISVSADEVNKELKSYNLPANPASRDMVRAGLLRNKLLAEYFDPQVLTSAEQRHVMALFLESRSQANAVRTRLESGEDFAKLASEVSLDDFSKQNKGDLGWRPKGVLPALLGSTVVEDFAFGSQAQVGKLEQPILDQDKTKPVGYWLVRLVTREEDLKAAHIQIMLLSSQEEAEAVRSRLESGEDFSQLAKDRSQHEASKNDGGDLSNFAPGTISDVVDQFVFNPTVEPGTLSQPLRDDKATTTGGYWLVKVAEVDSNRKIADEDRNVLKTNALNEWLVSIFTDPNNKIETYLDAQKIQYAISQVLGG